MVGTFKTCSAAAVFSLQTGRCHQNVVHIANYSFFVVQKVEKVAVTLLKKWVPILFKKVIAKLMSRWPR